MSAVKGHSSTDNALKYAKHQCCFQYFVSKNTVIFYEYFFST